MIPFSPIPSDCLPAQSLEIDTRFRGCKTFTPAGNIQWYIGAPVRRLNRVLNIDKLMKNNVHIVNSKLYPLRAMAYCDVTNVSPAGVN